jgi:hypothetical protein
MSKLEKTSLALFMVLLVWAAPLCALAQEGDPASAEGEEAAGEPDSDPRPSEPDPAAEPAGEAESPEEPALASEGEPDAAPVAGATDEREDPPLEETEQDLVADGEEPLDPYYLPEGADYPEAPAGAVLLDLEEPPLPFAQGDMELGLGLGLAGGSEVFYLGLGGAFAYYVVNRLAPGIDLQYTKIFSDFEYPDSFRLLPFLKFVILRNARFAPYLIVAGGHEFQWGGSQNPTKGVRETDAWIFGGGAGAHIGLGEHFAIKIQLLALYYWYTQKKIFGLDDTWFDDELDGEAVAFVDDGLKPCDEGDPGCTSYYSRSGDTKDRDGELFFPLVTIGMAFFF